MYKRNCFLLASLHAYKEHIPIQSTAVKIHPKLNLWDWAGWRGDIHTQHMLTKFQIPLVTSGTIESQKWLPKHFLLYALLHISVVVAFHFCIFILPYLWAPKKRITFTNLIIGIVDFYFGRFQRFTCRITSRRET